jgi:hypothetical protein
VQSNHSTLERPSRSFNSSTLVYDRNGFGTLSGLLRLLTKYQVHHLHAQVLHGLSAAWLTKLAQWETRESNVTNSHEVYEPRQVHPHPMYVLLCWRRFELLKLFHRVAISLARAIDGQRVVPAALYDLSCFPPSDAVAGHMSRELWSLSPI